MLKLNQSNLSDLTVNWFNLIVNVSLTITMTNICLNIDSNQTNLIVNMSLNTVMSNMNLNNDLN